MAGKAIRPVRVDGDVAFVTLTQGLEAIIDAADVHLVEAANWYAVKDQRKFYAQRKVTRDGKCQTIKLHRVILPSPAEVAIDHKNGDGLDCRRSNLRAATCAENLWNVGPRSNNTSGIKGVNWHKKSGLWEAQIVFNKKRKHLGRFKNKEDAREAYENAARRYHGQFARL